MLTLSRLRLMEMEGFKYRSLVHLVHNPVHTASSNHVTPVTVVCLGAQLRVGTQVEQCHLTI